MIGEGGSHFTGAENSLPPHKCQAVRNIALPYSACTWDVTSTSHDFADKITTAGRMRLSHGFVQWSYESSVCSRCERETLCQVGCHGARRTSTYTLREIVIANLMRRSIDSEPSGIVWRHRIPCDNNWRHLASSFVVKRATAWRVDLLFTRLSCIHNRRFAKQTPTADSLGKINRETVEALFAAAATTGT